MKRLTLILLLLASVAAYPQANLSITDFGATGGDTTNDTTAIVNTINAAISQGKGVLVPAGTFYHTNFTLNGVDMTGVSNTTSILHAFDPVNNTVFIIGNGVKLSNIQLTSAETVRTAVDWPLFIDHAANFIIDRIIIDGGNSGGMINFGGTNGIIINNEVKNTLADGIHNTEGANAIIVANNKVRSTSDDMIAVVSYAGTVGEKAFNVLIQDNDVGAQVGGRGITTVGGSDITIQRNIIDSSRGAGVLIATEPAFTSPPLSNVLVQNNTLSNNATGNSHAAILNTALNGNIDRVRIQNNSITQPINQSIRLEGATSNTAIITNTMVDTQGSGIVVNSGQTNVFCSGNTMNGNPNTHANCTGANNFTVTGSSLTYTSTCPGVIGICPTSASITGTGAITEGPSTVTATGTSPSLLSHWKFDETSGTTSVDSADGNNLTLNGGSSFVSAHLNLGLSLDGTTGFASDTVTTGLNVVNTLSITGWLKPTSTPPSGTSVVFQKSNGTPSTRGYSLTIVNGNLAFRKVGAGTITSTVPVTTGSFNHYAVTWNSATTQILFYKNGTLQQTVTDAQAFTTPVDSDPVNIGRNVNGSEFYNGVVDDLRIYNHVLQPSQVATLGQEPQTGGASTGSAAITEGPSTVSGTGVVGGGSITGAGAITEGPSIVGGTGTAAQTTSVPSTIPKYSDTLFNARLNTIETTVGPSPILRLCGGPRPATASEPDGGTELVRMNLPLDWATTSVVREISKLGPWEGIVKFPGPPTHFRIYAADGVTSHIQGSVTGSAGGGVITLGSTSLVPGQKNRINTFKITAQNSGMGAPPAAANRLLFSPDVQNAGLNQLLAVIGPSPILRFMTGTPPAAVTDAATGSVVATINLPPVWLSVSGGVGQKVGTWQDPAGDMNGTPTYARFFNSTGTIPHIQVDVTHSGVGGGGEGALQLATVPVTTLDSVTVTSFTLQAANQ